MKRELRKTEDKLVIDGLGVIIFAAWAVIRSFMLIWLGEEYTAVEAAESVSSWLFVFFILLFSALLVTPRLFVGFSAVAEGRGKRRGHGYLIVAGLIVVFNLALYVAALVFTIRDPDSFGMTADRLITMVIDGTSLWILIEMIVSARKVRRLRIWAKE